MILLSEQTKGRDNIYSKAGITPLKQLFEAVMKPMKTHKKYRYTNEKSNPVIWGNSQEKYSGKHSIWISNAPVREIPKTLYAAQRGGDNMRERDKAVIVRLNEEEKEHLQKQAAIAGLKKEPFIRKLIMGSDIQPRPPDELPKLLREINYIGHNINQIAHKVNAEDKAAIEQLFEVERLLGEIYREVKR